MKFNAHTIWHANYAARFKPMAKAQIDAIEIALHESENATREEIDQAVASLCTSWNMDGTPNITHISTAIRSIRGTAGRIKTPNRVTFYDGEQNQFETTMVDLKRRLYSRPTPVEAWNIICTPINSDQCAELKEFAEAKGIEYKRFVPNIAEIVGRVAGMVAV